VKISRKMAVSWGSVFCVSLLLVLVASIATTCSTLPVEKILKDLLVWIDKNLGISEFLVLVRGQFRSTVRQYAPLVRLSTMM